MESITVENLKQNKNKTMLIRMSAIKKSQIDSVADELGLSTSAFVRLSVDNFIKNLG